MRLLVTSLLFCSSNLRVFGQSSPNAEDNCKYDEVVVVSKIQGLMKQIEHALQSAPPDNAGLRYLGWQENPELVDIGWLIVVAGEYSRGSDALKDVLFQVQAKLGHLDVPYWVCSKERHERVVASYGCASPVDSAVRKVREPGFLYSLAIRAEEAITKRSGFKFEGYKGPSFYHL